MDRKDPNQGEGDRASARRYDTHVEDFVATGRVPEAAREAEDYVEREPEDAAKAEREAKRGPNGRRRLSIPTSIDDLVARGRTVLDRMRPAYERLRARLARHK